MLSAVLGFSAGGLFTQFLIQAIYSFSVGLIVVSGLLVAKVRAQENLMHLLAVMPQTFLYGALAYGLYWLAGKNLDLSNWNLGTVSAAFGYILAVFYAAPQIGGKLLLARMCAFVPGFAEDAMSLPVNERVTFARERSSRG
jgi:hypothetical protein